MILREEDDGGRAMVMSDDVFRLRHHVFRLRRLEAFNYWTLVSVYSTNYRNNGRCHYFANGVQNNAMNGAS